MGRRGQLVLDRGELDGEQLIPAKTIESIRQGGDPDAFAKTANAANAASDATSLPAYRAVGDYLMER